MILVLILTISIVSCKDIDDHIEDEESIEGNLEQDLDRPNADEIEDVNYLLMWNNYSDNYEDSYIRLAGKIHYVSEDSINIREGLDGVTGNIYMTFEENLDQLESLSEGDYIIVSGKVKGKLAGQISINNAKLEAVGNEALERVERERLEAEESFEEQRLEKEKLAAEEREDYMTKVETINYENLVREPYEYKDRKIKVTIRISQIMVGGILKESGYSGKDGDNEWYISYELPENSKRILEGDLVTFYGDFDDVVKMKRRITREEVYLPRLKARYYEILE